VPDKKSDDQYTDEEAQRRFEASLRGARVVGHESMKDISPKRAAPTRALTAKPGKVEACAQPVIEAFEELRLLLEQPGCPSGATDSFLQMIQHLDKCVRVKLAYETAARTGKATIILEPTNLFARFMTAFRAGDWPLVSIIEHEMVTPTI
jgi:hypothetical protein